ncbi:MAG: hypothetical protein ACLUEK_06225 [Oscillospiraceae bacterium]
MKILSILLACHLLAGAVRPWPWTLRDPRGHRRNLTEEQISAVC